MVIPVRDEANTIEALLQDLQEQRRRPTAILVVDTGSLDDTASRVAAMAQRDPSIQLLSAPGAYPGGGRNAAVRVTQTEWIAFADAGTRLGSDWLELLLEPVDQGEPVDAVLGGLEPVVETRFQRAAALAYISRRESLPSGGSWRGYCLPSSAVRTSIVRRLRGFSEALRCGEDLHFYRRLRETARIAHAPGAIVHWSIPTDLGALWRRFRTYAEHALQGGFTKGWIGTLSRRYGIMLVCFGPAMPVAAAAFLLTRAAVMQHRKPEWADRTWLGRLRQVIEVGVILGAIDAAIWAGWWAWRRRGAPSAEPFGPADLASIPAPANKRSGDWVNN